MRLRRVIGAGSLASLGALWACAHQGSADYFLGVGMPPSRALALGPSPAPALLPTPPQASSDSNQGGSPVLGPAGGGGGLTSPSGPTLTVRIASAWSLRWLAGSVPDGPASSTPAQAATLQGAGGMVVGAEGNTYLIEGGRHAIWEATATGAWLPIAGSSDGLPGYYGEHLFAIASALDGPRALARDEENGLLCVTESSGRRLRQFSTFGRIYSLAGGGADPSDSVANPLEAQLGEADGLAFDARGRIYFSERDTKRVRSLQVSGLSTLCRLSGAAGPLPLAAEPQGRWVWVGEGDTVWQKSPTAVSPQVWVQRAGWRVKALAYDRVGRLYLAEDMSLPSGATVGRVEVVGVGADGSVSLAPRLVAGSGLDTTNPLSLAFPALSLADAKQQPLGELADHGLALDLAQAASTTEISGHIHVAQVLPGGRAQVARLQP